MAEAGGIPVSRPLTLSIVSQGGRGLLTPPRLSGSRLYVRELFPVPLNRPCGNGASSDSPWRASNRAATGTSLAPVSTTLMIRVSAVLPAASPRISWYVCVTT